MSGNFKILWTVLRDKLRRPIFVAATGLAGFFFDLLFPSFATFVALRDIIDRFQLVF
jgi:hypothetical protein